MGFAEEVKEGVQGVELVFGGGEIDAGSDAIGHDGHGVAGGVRGLESVEGILDDEAILRGEAEPLGGFEKEVGSGFDLRGIAAADGFLKEVAELE